MDSNLLKAKSLSVKRAYVYFFILQAPYAYVGERLMQILYWPIALIFYGAFLNIEDAPEGGIFILCLAAIWPINQFFAIPNKIKKHNLKIYEEMMKT